MTEAQTMFVLIFVVPAFVGIHLMRYLDRGDFRFWRYWTRDGGR